MATSSQSPTPKMKELVISTSEARRDMAAVVFNHREVGTQVATAQVPEAG